MSRIMMNGKIRTSRAREAYIEQVPYNRDKKRNSFIRLHSYDDSDVAYRSTPEYLKHVMNTSISSNGHSSRPLTRTNSASDMTSTTYSNRPVRGNPKYKTQEEYYDEIQFFKKELTYTKADNNNLRAKIRRLEEDNARKRKEINSCYDTNKDTDLRRTLAGSTNSSANVVMNLKQRLFKLDLQLKQKETTIDEMKSDPRWTKSTELEVQNRALLNEIEKLKLEKINLAQNDYMVSIDEETKNAIRKMEAEKNELILENQSLKKKVDELNITKRDGELSARHRDGSIEKDLRRKIENLKEQCKDYRMELDEKQDELKKMRNHRDEYRHKFNTISEDLEELKHERDKYRKKFNQVSNDLEEMQKENERKTKSNGIYRSSPILSRDEENSKKFSPPSRIHRDLSPTDDIFKKDSRPSTPVRKSKEQISSRSPLNSRKTMTSSKIPSRTSHRDGWTSDDEDRLKKFREKRAATVIQRGWREHTESTKNSFTSKSRENSFDKRNPKSSGMKSSDIMSPRHRSTSTIMSNESALKIVQAALRGCINRLESDKNSRNEKSLRNEFDDDYLIRKPSKQFGPQYEADRKRENLFKTSKSNYGDIDHLFNDKIGSNNRLPISSQDSFENYLRSVSPKPDNNRPSSPYVSGGINSKQIMPNERNKFGFENRNNRESLIKSPSPYSPFNEHRSVRNLSPEDTRPSSRQSNTSLRKSTAYSKQPPKVTDDHDDDDDIRGY